MSDQSTNTRPSSLESCVYARHSVRVFKSDPVDTKVLQECLHLAQRAPSNSNIQNWRITLAQGAARDRIVSALKSAASQGPPKIPPLPEKFAHFRSDFGKVMYGSAGFGVPREDTEGVQAVRMRNFEFWDAPVAGVVSMDQVLDYVDALSVGLFMQTFLLALTEKGLGSCMQVSVTGYPEVLRKEFGLDAEQRILCGIAIGVPAEHRVNSADFGRQPLENAATILTE